MSRLIDVDTLIAELMKHIWDDKKFSEIVKDVPTIHAIPIDRIEQARREIEFADDTTYGNYKKTVLSILDKLIEESEDK